MDLSFFEGVLSFAVTALGPLILMHEATRLRQLDTLGLDLERRPRWS